MIKNRDLQKAKVRAGARLSFKIHLGVFAAVCGLCALINLVYFSGYWWSLWLILGWGIGVVSHYVGVYVLSGSDSISDRMIKEELDKIQSKRESKNT